MKFLIIQKNIKFSLEEIIEKMQKLSKTFYDGKIIFEGLTLAIVGPPNVGKSSLMNALLNKNRAIVTPIAGTTRDSIEENIYINDLHFKIIDTAGIRKTKELIEKEGINRTKETIKKADIVLLMFDLTENSLDQELLKLCPKEKTIILWNKLDLINEKKNSSNKKIFLSAKTKEGIDKLKEEIEKLIWQNGYPSKEEVMITKQRHKLALEEAIKYCETVLQGFKKGISPELISIDMKASLEELNSIIGININEDILTKIFSKFCIGK